MSDCSAALAMPKSASLTWPLSRARSRLPGLTSRCTTPLRWAKSSPRQAWRRMSTASAGSSRPSSLRISAQLGPSTHSMTMNWRPVDVLRPVSKTCTMFGCTSLPAARASRWKRVDEVRVGREVLREQLHGHVALQPRVHRELHGRHAPGRRGGARSDSGRRRGSCAVIRPSAPTPPDPSGCSGAGSPPVPGSGVVGRRRRGGRASGWASGSASGVGVGVAVSVGAGVAVSVGSGVTVSSGSSPQFCLDLPVEVIEPVGDVLLQRLVGPRAGAR